MIQNITFTGQNNKFSTFLYKNDMAEILYCTEAANYIQFRA